MLTPTADFAVDPDQTVPRRAVRFGSKLFATKTSYGLTNIANPVQATPRIDVCYGITLFATKMAYGSLCQGNATYAYVNDQYPIQTNIWDQDQTAAMRSGSILIASKTSFNNELVDDIWVVM